jgi:hypothetical protein
LVWRTVQMAGVISEQGITGDSIPFLYVSDLTQSVNQQRLATLSALPELDRLPGKTPGPRSSSNDGEVLER